MNKRLQSLIDRGYSEDEVIRLSSFTENDILEATKTIYKHIIKDCSSVDNPYAIYLGGQPGCGKSIYSIKLKERLKNVVEIGIDNYRMYHPHYLEIEDCINKYWEGKTPTENSSPGNDIADFTHEFAGVITDKLINFVSNEKYNMVLEWGMRNPTEPLKCMKELHFEGYSNYVNFIATNKDVSYEACQKRVEILKNYKHIIRKVPKSFHDLAISTLPDSVQTIYEEMVKDNYINNLTIISREGKVLWNRLSPESPKEIYKNALNSPDLKMDINSDLLSLQASSIEFKGIEEKIHKYQSMKDDIVISTFIGSMFEDREEEIYNGKSTTYRK